MDLKKTLGYTAILLAIAAETFGFNFKPKLPTTNIPVYIPSKVIDHLGDMMFELKLASCSLATHKKDIAFVKTVSDAIIAAAKKSEYAKTAKKFDWEVKLIQNDSKIDAFALPGGKIGVYTGLFKVVQDNDAKLGVVLGHEVVHALARHANDRMDQELKRAILLAATGHGLRKEGLSPELTIGVMVAMGVAYEGAVINPFIRKHESVADQKGLRIMARAGYDPKVAVDFWARLKEKDAAGVNAEGFFSNHPSYDTRIAQLKKWMPQAVKYYRK